VGLTPRDFIGKACGISVLSGPAFFFEDVLDLDQLARILHDVEANGVGGGRCGKLFATVPSIAQIAHFAHALFIGL
jgi:hypothetical protein